ncbi:hypothetical protein EDD16DRAFT_128580 [Pisolithus croceorrhizus]|nr:hypothetical protein EDD16DRAFT_128580 [Pisolithus croceorrhizus]
MVHLIVVEPVMRQYGIIYDRVVELLQDRLDITVNSPAYGQSLPQKSPTFLAPSVYPSTRCSLSAASASAIATIATHPFVEFFIVVSVRECCIRLYSPMSRLDQRAGLFRRMVPRICIHGARILARKMLQLLRVSCIKPFVQRQHPWVLRR